MAQIGTDIHAAVNCLNEGNLIGIPTETVYGLAANALNPKAVASIFSAKNRPHFDPLIVHIGSALQMEEFATDIPDYARKLAKAFWPGPITLILRKKSIIPDIVTSGADTVGLRVPDQTLTLELLQNLKFPLAAPSANPFGYVSPTSAQHVNAQLGNAVCYILDGGQCKVGIESTIIDCSGETAILLRLGGLSVESIESITGKIEINISSHSNPKAPGQLDSHYSPHCKLEIGIPEKIVMDNQPAALVLFSKQRTDYPINHQFILSAEGIAEEAAVNLFSTLRKLDELGYKKAFAELLPEEGLGRAINDRLKRAAF